MTITEKRLRYISTTTLAEKPWGQKELFILELVQAVRALKKESLQLKKLKRAVKEIREWKTSGGTKCPTIF